MAIVSDQNKDFKLLSVRATTFDDCKSDFVEVTLSDIELPWKYDVTIRGSFSEVASELKQIANWISRLTV